MHLGLPTLPSSTEEYGTAVSMHYQAGGIMSQSELFQVFCWAKPCTSTAVMPTTQAKTEAPWIFLTTRPTPSISPPHGRPKMCASTSSVKATVPFSIVQTSGQRPTASPTIPLTATSAWLDTPNQTRLPHPSFGNSGLMGSQMAPGV